MSKEKIYTNKILYYFVFICVYTYRFIKYVYYGIIWPVILLSILINDLKAKSEIRKIKKMEKVNEKESIEESKRLKKEKQKIDTESYKDETVKFERKNLGYYINAFLLALISVPKGIKKKIDNIALIRQARNKKDLETKAMLVDFSQDDSENKGKRIVWKYIAVNDKGRKVTGYFEAYSRLDVQSFLLGEGLNAYSIRTSPFIQSYYKSFSPRVRFKNKDLIFLLAQLSTYLKSGIPLVECLNILIRQVPKKSQRNVLRAVTYDLTVGETFSFALEKRGMSFPKLLINMVKASELTGELPEALDDMVNYYTEAEDARKSMISALSYPSLVFIFTIAVVTFVMVYVVPKFVDIYSTMESSEIPKFTMFIMNLSAYLKKNLVFILIVIFGIIFALIYLYRNVKIIRTFFQWTFMHIPVLKDVIIYNEVTMFSKTFASLLAHNVYITDSMDILNRITNNEIYKMMILDTVANLARGDKISTAFKDQWAFPVPAYEMIVTGEKTGQLAEMMSKVSAYYQSLHKNMVARIKALVEPILIIFLTFTVGAVLLAVIIPMFNMYQQVQNLG